MVVVKHVVERKDMVKRVTIKNTVVCKNIGIIQEDITHKLKEKIKYKDLILPWN